MKSKFALYAIILVLILLNIVTEMRRNFAQSYLDKLERHSRSVYPHIPILDRDHDFVVDFFGYKYFGNSASDYGVLYWGAMEKPELYPLRDIAKKHPSQKLSFIDVGANKGQHSMFLSRHVSRVHSIEPSPPVLKDLNKHIEVNGIDNIVVHAIGLGDKEDFLPFFPSSGTNIHSGSFVDEFSPYNEAKPMKKLPIRTGDSVFSDLEGEDFGLIKIDVEGFEAQVLRGLSLTMKKFRPIILLEYHIGDEFKSAFKSRAELFSLLPPDYRGYQFSKHDYYTGDYELTELSDKKTVSRNILLLPVESDDLVPKRNS